MCVLLTKNSKDDKPHRTKLCIVALGNHNNRYCSKLDCCSSLLQYLLLRLLVSTAVGDRPVLQQGDCKNAFCQEVLPEDEHMVIHPLVGNPCCI